MDRTTDYLIQVKSTGHDIHRNKEYLPYFDLKAILMPSILFHRGYIPCFE